MHNACRRSTFNADVTQPAIRLCCRYRQTFIYSRPVRRGFSRSLSVTLRLPAAQCNVQSPLPPQSEPRRWTGARMFTSTTDVRTESADLRPHAALRRRLGGAGERSNIGVLPCIGNVPLSHGHLRFPADQPPSPMIRRQIGRGVPPHFQASYSFRLRTIRLRFGGANLCDCWSYVAGVISGAIPPSFSRLTP